jgi:hypothetical protein
MDRKTKKEIKEVVKKYVDRHWGKKAFAATSGVIIGATLGLDLIFTGGIGTTAVLASTGGAGLTGLLGRALAYSSEHTATNAAGQGIKTSNVDVEMALEKMESKLQAAFKKASSPGARQADKNQFMAFAADIEQDVKKLSPAFKIVSGKPKDKYEFIVAKSSTRKKGITLTQALLDMKQAPEPEKPFFHKSLPRKPRPQKKEIPEFEKRLEALKDLKNSNNPPSP